MRPYSVSVLSAWQCLLFSPHLCLCPHLNPKLLIKVSWAEENAAAVHTEWLKRRRSHLWKRPLETKYPEWTVRMAKHKQVDRFCSLPPLFLPYSVWVCQTGAVCLASPWRSDLRSSSAAAFQHKQEQPGLKSHIINQINESQLII